jgi:repressor LexA
MPPNELTPRQAEILAFIQRCLRDSGLPPTQDDIAQEFGFSSSTAAREHLLAIERKGYIELRARNARGIRVLVGADERSPRHQMELPLLGRVAAGSPILAEENIDTWLRIDPGLFRPRADFLHRVSGESMREADIFDGDLVGIHAQTVADNGQIVVARITDPTTGEDTITLKRYFRRGRKVILKPENSAPAYKPIEIDLAQRSEDQDAAPFQIAGIYVGLIRGG